MKEIHDFNKSNIFEDNINDHGFKIVAPRLSCNDGQLKVEMEGTIDLMQFHDAESKIDLLFFGNSLFQLT